MLFLEFKFSSFRVSFFLLNSFLFFVLILVFFSGAQLFLVQLMRLLNFTSNLKTIYKYVTIIAVKNRSVMP